MIRNKPQIPERTPILSFPTPEGKADMVFFEMRDGSLPKNKDWVYGEPHPDGANFPHHELVYVASDGSDPVWQRWFYAAKRELQHLYNWEYSDTADWPRITQTFLVKRGEFSPTATFDMPPLEHFPYPAEYSATGLEERPIGDETLASLYVTIVITRERLFKRTVAATLSHVTTTLGSTAITHDTNSAVSVTDKLLEGIGIPPGTTGTRVSNTSTTLSLPAYATGSNLTVEVVTYPPLAIIGYEFDPDTGSMKPYQRTKVPAGTMGTVIQPDGSFSEIQPASTLWSVKTTKQATGLPGIAVNGVSSRTFKMVVQWSWPRVLNYVYIQPVYADEADIYSTVTGYVTTPHFLTEGYSGPCLATITETWTSKMPKISSEGGSANWDSNSLDTVYPLLEQPTVLLPKAIQFDSPKLNVSVGECLHDYINFQYGSFFMEYLATSPIRWPATLLASVDLRPYQGGWLKKIMLIDAPSVVGAMPELLISSSSILASGFTLNWASTVDPALLAANPGLSVINGNSALSLDVSTDPTFTGASLTGYPMSVLGTVTKVLTSVPRGKTYYCRIKSTKTVSGSPVIYTSNIATVALVAQAELLVYDTDGVTLIPKTTGTLAFGTIYRGVDTPKTITVKNDGLLTLTGIALNFSGTNGDFCSVVGTLPTSIAAGASATVQINVNATSVPAGGGVLAAIATVTSSALSSPTYAFNISGTVTEPEINVTDSGGTHLTGTTITLANTNTGSETFHTLTIQNTGTAPLNISPNFSSTSGDWYVVTSPDSVIAAGGSSTMQIKFRPTVGGVSSGTLSIANNDSTGSENPYVLTLSATGVAISTLVLENSGGSPLAASYNFGTIPTSDYRYYLITVRNTGAATLTLSAAITGADASSFGYTLGAASVATGATTTLTVSFHPTTTNGKVGVLTITSNDPAHATTVLNLVGTGGNAQEIQVEYPVNTPLVSNVGSIDFGTILLGSSVTRRIFVRNIGHTALSSLAVTITGADASKYSATGLISTTTGSVVTSLADSASGYYDVTFSPIATTDPTTATINIASNDADENPFLIAVTGAGDIANSLHTNQASSVILGRTSATDTYYSAPVSGALLQRYPGDVAVSNTGRVAITDTYASRILIWNSYAALVTGQAASIVLGQTSLTAAVTSPATPTASNMSSPQSVAWYGDKLLMGDATFRRVLIWDNPTVTNQAANLVLGQSSFTLRSTRTTSSSSFSYSLPSIAVSSTGKLVIVDGVDNRVLIWNTFPTVNDTPASVVIGQANFTSNTSGLTWDGTAGKPRFYTPYTAAIHPVTGDLYILDAGNYRVVGYSGIPNVNDSIHQCILLQSSVSARVIPMTTTRTTSRYPVGLSFSSTGVMALSDIVDKRILIFFTTPTTNGVPANVVLGQPDFTTNATLAWSNASTQYVRSVKWEGNDLLALDEARVMIFKP